MLVPGHESDQYYLVIFDRSTGNIKNLTKEFNESIGQIVWSPDSKIIYFTAENEIFNSVFKIDINNGKIKMILKQHSNTDLTVSPDGATIYFKQQKSTQPYEIFAMNTDGGDIRQVTHSNKEILSNIEMIPIDTFWCKGAAGKNIQSILVKPPFFDSTKKYPLIFLIHGGPQGH